MQSIAKWQWKLEPLFHKKSWRKSGKEGLRETEQGINNSFFFFRRRLTSGLSTIAPVKTRSIDSVDDLGSETDNEMLQGSFEDIVIRGTTFSMSLFSEDQIMFLLNINFCYI